MIYRAGPRIEEGGLQGDLVSTERVRFGSQPEQIMFLRRVVTEYRCSYAIRARARDIVFRQRCCPPKDKVSQAVALGSWVNRNITYVEELPETFQTPTSTVSQGYGDCDDFSTLIGALCESIGIECELVGMEWGDGADRYYRHIFPRAVISGPTRTVRIPLDATAGDPADGIVDPIAVSLARGDDLRLFVT